MARTSTATKEQPQVQEMPPAPVDNLPAPRPRAAVAPIVPANWQEITAIAGAICRAKMAPKSYCDQQGNPYPDKVAIAIMHGMEVGMTPMASLQSLAVINGMPSLYGDGMLAVVRASGYLEDIIEEMEWDTHGPVKATCKVKRKGEPTWGTMECARADAQKAGWWGKSGPWSATPHRMMQMRARGWALRDKFADVLRGLHSAEEAEDMVDITPQATATTGPVPAEPRREDYAAQANTQQQTGRAEAASNQQQPAEGTPHTDPPPAGQDAGKRDAASGGGGDSASAQPGPDTATKPAAKPKDKKAAAKEKATDVVDQNEPPADEQGPVVQGEIDTEIKFAPYTSAGKFYDFSDTFLQSEATTPAQARAWRTFYDPQISKMLTHEKDTVRAEINDTLTLYLKKVGVAPDPKQEREPGEEG